ncbi:MAG TPA: BrnA antitoxin family protein [Pyrinomonadaceae bacterium]|nr:BrnA antitoxin family protein [Pyrinomonadaceae bacterium]
MPTTIEKEENLSESDLDARLDKMKRLPRGSFKAKPNATKLENCKVKISLYVDGDVLEYFKKRAEQPNAAPYQTQINNELRRAMENDSRETASIENDILNNEEFLRALKEKLETV